MLFLLPPSETKAVGGVDINIANAAVTFGVLNSARDKMLEAVADPSLLVAPTMRAIDRYTGTLYSAIHGRGLKGSPTSNNTLSAVEYQRAKEMVLIQSALFGLISATDLIPSYKINPSKIVNGISPKRLWPEAHASVWTRLATAPIIDLRSKAYAELAPVPDSLEVYQASVFVVRPDGSREQLNHFNKKAKGQLVRAALTAKQAPQTLKELAAAAKRAGLEIELNGRDLLVLTKQEN